MLLAVWRAADTILVSLRAEGMGRCMMRVGRKESSKMPFPY